MEKNLEKALEKIRKVLSKRPEVLAAYLYGSHAKGYARDDSDIDVAVMLDSRFPQPDSYDYMFKLEDEINKAVPEFKVEVIPTVHMSYPLNFTAPLFGKLIRSRDDALRVREELRLENEFEDLRTLYDIRHESILEDVKGRLNA